MAQSDLLLALQILLDHDGLTEEAHTQTLFSIAQLLGGFEHLGVCTQIRLLLRVLRMHVLEEEAEWDAAPAMSYLEQLHMLAKDSGLPAFVDAAHVAPPPNLLVEVKTQIVLQQETQEAAVADVGKHFSSAGRDSAEGVRMVELQWALANPSSKNTFTASHSLESAACDIKNYVKAARQALGPIIVEGGFYGRQHGGFFDPSGQLNPTAFISANQLPRARSGVSNGGLKRQTEQFYDVAGPSIMHQVMQTAAEATGQPAFVPPAAMPGAAFLSPQRTNTVSDPLWESDPPSSVEQKQKQPRPRPRLKWTVEEDQKLKEWVEERGMGTCDWAGFIRHNKGHIDPKRTAVDAKDRWRNIVKKREQLQQSIQVLEQVQAQQEQQRIEAERREALLAVAETELQRSQDEEQQTAAAPATAPEAIPTTVPEGGPVPEAEVVPDTETTPP